MRLVVSLNISLPSVHLILAAVGDVLMRFSNFGFAKNCFFVH